ncbi:MAG: HAD-IIB family hydrolase [Gammaproteobacteria bacterium]
MSEQYLICCDMDRTVIPNGYQPESPGARPLFKELVADDAVRLAYVTGRHRHLVESAIRSYQLPTPDFVITDVGSRIWSVNEEGWSEISQWQLMIGKDWGSSRAADLRAALAPISLLRPQEPSKQAPFKLSFYVNRGADQAKLEASIAERLDALDIQHRQVWSMDEPAGVQLLDILPLQAGKLGAIEFLAHRLHLPLESLIFAGDSGNDLEVLVSEVPSVLVANAADDVRESAREALLGGSSEAAYYEAKGGSHGMNGNYCAGVVEGVGHFLPELMARVLGQRLVDHSELEATGTDGEVQHEKAF